MKLNKAELIFLPLFSFPSVESRRISLRLRIGIVRLRKLNSARRREGGLQGVYKKDGKGLLKGSVVSVMMVLNYKRIDLD